MNNDKLYFRPKARLVLFSETRTEWLLATYGGFQVIITLDFLPRFRTWFFNQGLYLYTCILIYYTCILIYYACILVYLSTMPVYLSTKPLSIVTLYTNLGFVSALFLLSPCIIILDLFQHYLSIVTLYNNLGFVSALVNYYHPVY